MNMTYNLNPIPKMKRYRVCSFDFDSRIIMFESLENRYEKNPTQKLKEELQREVLKFSEEYGSQGIQNKIMNLKNIGAKRFSIISYHNEILTQIRNAFVCGNYYPALTGACALGERILNHLIIDLRDYYKSRESYEGVKDKKASSNWQQMINALSDWNILLPSVKEKFEILKNQRHKAIHFNPKLASRMRQSALDAILSIQSIIYKQFAAGGEQPWFLISNGEIYLKQKWESHPYIIKYYIPTSDLIY